VTPEVAAMDFTGDKGSRNMMADLEPVQHLTKHFLKFIRALGDPVKQVRHFYIYIIIYIEVISV